jgi:CheY-like chemotaxis protein
MFQGDRDALGKVFEHILQNALKFTPEGGRVTVAARVQSPGGVELRVTDTGKGVPAQALPYVFQKFFHADQTLTRPYGGLGLGLAYCKHVVDAHEGRIWLESAGPDQGTTVHITFPRWAPSPGTAGGKSKTILWVDDNPTMLELMEVGFSSFPEQVRLMTCQSGADALDTVRASPPDLIVLDMMMPGMSGLDVLNQLKFEKRFSGIPVVVVTGHREAAEEALRHGAVDFFLKPFRVTEMVEKIRRHLGWVQGA